MEEIVRALNAARTITLVSHVKPDGDAVGSLLGLSLALQSMGKKTTPVLFDGVPAVFSYLKNSDLVATDLPADADVCVLLDAGSGSRTGFPEVINQYIKKDALIIIDHHPKAELAKTVPTYLHRIDASSASELVFELLQHLGVKLTGALCTCLLTGLYTDTGGFQFSNTTPRCLEVAAELLRRGANLQSITGALAADRSLTSLKLLGIALERARACGGGTITYLLYEDFQRLNASDEELYGIVNQLHDLPRSYFALLLTEHDKGVIRGNLRGGEWGIDVSALARLFCGGGHVKAAGFSFPGQLVETNGWVCVEELAPVG